MKKIKILTMALVLGAINFCAFAQTQKGNMLVGGNIGFNSSSAKIKTESGSIKVESKGPSITNIYINPNIGYFFIDNLAGGLKLNVGLSSSKSRADGDKRSNATTEFNVGPFLRYYYNLNEKSAVFGEAFVGFGSTTTKEKDITGTSLPDLKTSGVSYGPGVGFAYFINENIGVEALLNYTFSVDKDESTLLGVTTTTRTSTGKFGLNVGFQLYL